MSAAHVHAFYRHGDSPLHRLAPECKLATVFCFVLVVVATPREQFWAFGGYAALLAVVAAIGHVPPGFIARRTLIEVPFVCFAVLLPFIATGERVEVFGLSVAESGLLGAFNIIAKGTIGVVASILLAATTPVRDILHGMERLRLPRAFVLIAGFMVRYASVVTEEMHRMRVARESRGFEARSTRQVKAVAAAAGALFIRSYERGERVYLAMLSRGYSGTMPRTASASPGTGQWARAAVLPVAALLVSVAAWMVEMSWWM